MKYGILPLMDTLYIVMPAYNEEQNIEYVIKQWYPMLTYGSKDSRLVVADSGSKDRTREILYALRKDYPKIEILDTEYKEHGPKLLSLYKYACDRGANFVFQTDSDGQTDPSDFPGFWNLRNYHDAVIGNRRGRGDGKMRSFVEGVVCLLLFLFFGVRIPDANAPFRLMKTSLLSKYTDRLPEDYYLTNVMLTAFFAFYHENITFRKIRFTERLQGENKVDMVSITKIGLSSLYHFFKFRVEMNATDRPES